MKQSKRLPSLDLPTMQKLCVSFIRSAKRQTLSIELVGEDPPQGPTSSVLFSTFPKFKLHDLQFPSHTQVWGPKVPKFMSLFGAWMTFAPSWMMYVMLFKMMYVWPQKSPKQPPGPLQARSGTLQAWARDGTSSQGLGLAMRPKTPTFRHTTGDTGVYYHSY